MTAGGTLGPDTAALAADLLTRCRKLGERIEQLPADLRPATRAEGYAIQARLGPGSAAPQFGWKIAATSAAGQAHIGVSGPLAGRLFAETVIPDGGLCPLGANQMRVAELEFAFRMKETLAPRPQRYSIDEVLAAVATLHPAIEIPDSRLESFAQAGEAQLIADNACANYFVLGPAAPDGWREIDLASHPATVRLNDGDPVAGNGSNVLGDPRIALAWIANELSEHGIALQAGEVITTGTCVTPVPISAGDRISGDLGMIGKVSVTIGA